MAAGRSLSSRKTSPSRARTGNGQAMPAEMLYQSEEKRQIGRINTIFIKRQDEATLLGVEQVVRIFHTFGNASCREGFADFILGDEGGQVLVANFCVDSHGVCLK